MLKEFIFPFVYDKMEKKWRINILCMCSLSSTMHNLPAHSVYSTKCWMLFFLCLRFCVAIFKSNHGGGEVYSAQKLK